MLNMLYKKSLYLQTALNLKPIIFFVPDPMQIMDYFIHVFMLNAYKYLQQFWWYDLITDVT